MRFARSFDALLALTCLAACGGTAAVAPAPVTSAQVETARQRWPDTTEASLVAGRELFLAKCSGCHAYPDLQTIDEGRWPKILHVMGPRASLDQKQVDRVLRYVVSAHPSLPNGGAVSTAPPTPTLPSAVATTRPPAKDPLEVTVTIPDRLRAIVDAKDRLPEDTKLDKGRHAAELLAFMGVAQGQRIAEIGSYQGYMAELLARAVAPTGRVYAQDPAKLNTLTKENWAARKSPALASITRVERPFDDPLPPELKDLDAVVCGLFYHDMVWLNIDRAKLNQAAFRALKSGGAYYVYDHSSKEGAGTGDAKTIHRIEEKVARAEIEAAGFKLAATASFLRNPADTRDWDASDDGPADRRGTSDRFVLQFVKP